MSLDIPVLGLGIFLPHFRIVHEKKHPSFFLLLPLYSYVKQCRACRVTVIIDPFQNVEARSRKNFTSIVEDGRIFSKEKGHGTR